ncbi:MAG: O-antigen ligase family protein [Bacteroidota bacterium]
MINYARLKKYLGHQYIWVNLLAFILPLLFKLTPLIIILFSVVVLVQARFRTEESFRENKVWGFGILYLLYLAGALWTTNTGQLFSELETKLAILIFPLLFMFTRPLPKVVLDKVLLNFVLGCLINCLLSSWQGYTCFRETGAIDCFYSSQLSFSYHPSYLALYLNLASAILLYFDINKIFPYDIRPWMVRVLLWFFTVFTVFLASKMGLIGIGVVIAAYVFHYRRQLRLGIVAKTLLPMFLLLVGSLALSPATLLRFKTLGDTIKASSRNEVLMTKHVESSAARIEIWEISTEIGLAHFWTGLGTGDVSDHLTEKYKEKGMEEAAERQLNCHNQFFESFLAVGIAGLLCLLVIMGIAIYFGIRINSFIYLSFGLLCFCHFSVESMLETQSGVVFFAFFNSLFFVERNLVTDNESTDSSRS